MNRYVFYFLLLISFLGIPYFFYWILDTMVSLKYETDGNSYISALSGKDLSIQFEKFMSLTILSFVIFLLLLIFRKRIIKKGNTAQNKVQ